MITLIKIAGGTFFMKNEFDTKVEKSMEKLDETSLDMVVGGVSGQWLQSPQSFGGVEGSTISGQTVNPNDNSNGAVAAPDFGGGLGGKL